MSFHFIRNERGEITQIKTDLTGCALINHPFLNKGTAFNEVERNTFALAGLLPDHVETLDEQLTRAYEQYTACATDLDKHLYLQALHECNATLFYRLISDHFLEMVPIIYTPTIGEAIEKFSHIFRRSSGLFFSYPHQDQMGAALAAYQQQASEIDLIIVTDGEGILGIGDQGTGGIYICFGKAVIDTLCAGIDPMRILAIQLDVGTNNEILLNDPLYLGWRHPRVTGRDYDEFIDLFIAEVKKYFPTVFLHWEDFSRDVARRNLDRFRQTLCSFNDDIQGTGVVAVATLMSAAHRLGQKLSDQRIVMFGAGAAGTGVSDQIVKALQKEGLSYESACEKIWLINRQGLLVEGMENVSDFQRCYMKTTAHIKNWRVKDAMKITLAEVVENFQPTVLMGMSTVAGAFNESIVKAMASHVDHPIIMPLSNPTAKSEATPADLIRWTAGKALIATGSPFAPVTWNGRSIAIAQCNNAFAFPGMCLGALAVKARQFTDAMLVVACETLGQCAGLGKSLEEPLLPSLDQAKAISEKIAHAVAEEAMAEGVAEKTDIACAIRAMQWAPQYYEFC